MFKRLVIVGVVGAGAWWYWHKHDAPDFDPSKLGNPTAAAPSTSPAAALSDAEVAFRDHSSGVEVTLDGKVDRVLADDRSGSPHQRFIVRLPSGQTVLVAHNVELATRVAGLEAGAAVRVRGEYEWNDQGGVVHWTHTDPERKHEAGWIDFEGHRYQ